MYRAFPTLHTEFKRTWLNPEARGLQYLPLQRVES